MTPDEALQAAIASAIAAFDSGNHAWGRFFAYVLRPYRGHPPAPTPAAVRAALQEAALSVPQAADAAAAYTFYAALVTARGELEAFIGGLPDPLHTADVLQAPQALAEAIGWLEPWANER